MKGQRISITTAARRASPVSSADAEILLGFHYLAGADLQLSLRSEFTDTSVRCDSS